MAILRDATAESIAEAAAAIRDGGLVAFPTETVYGLGANALDPAAVSKIFAAKGRPAGNPLIVHIASPPEWEAIAWDTEKAQALIARFWPGPLTIVLPKKPAVPDMVTAGGPTVAVRMPSHPIALALIRAAGVPIAAPSANRSEHISPTQASHVALSLGDSVDIILDGGHTQVGLESTVVDLTESPARLLRPGMVLPEEIEEILGEPLVRDIAPAQVSRSPGQMRRHYAPRTPLRIIEPEKVDLAGIEESPLGFIALGDDALVPLGMSLSRSIILPADPAEYAARLYDALYELDEARLALILVQAVPEGDEWLAVRDRLSRAASSATRPDGV